VQTWVVENILSFVCAKGDEIIRAYLDYRRLDTVEQTYALNRLYDQMWLYYNFFQPVMHLAEKSIIQKEGKKNHIKRKYDQAQTPFDRLCATGCLDEGIKAKLERQREATNPRQLRQEIQEGLRRLRQLLLADSAQPEDVRQTLLQNREAQLEQLFTSSPLVMTADESLSVTLSFDRTISAR
jgi:curved DNA-binding protein CbpA